jgi:predicted heme/steroid binding protein
MQRNTKIILISCVVAVVAVIAGVVSTISSGNDSGSETQKTQDTTRANTQRPQNTTENTQSTEKTVTLKELSSHNTVGNCWTAISGKIYDLTTYIQKHPGGGEILRACGADGTSLFTSRTTDTGEKVGSGTGHSQNAQAQLNELKVGTLISE